MPPEAGDTIARRRVVLRRLSGAFAPLSASAGRPAPPPVRAHKVAGAQLAGVGIVGSSGSAPAGDLTSLTALGTSLWNVSGNAGMSMPPRCLPQRDVISPEPEPPLRRHGCARLAHLQRGPDRPRRASCDLHGHPTVGAHRGPAVGAPQRSPKGELRPSAALSAPPVPAPHARTGSTPPAAAAAASPGASRPRPRGATSRGRSTSA